MLRDYDKYTPRERADRAILLAELKAKGLTGKECAGCFHPAASHVAAQDSSYASMCKLCDCYCDCCKAPLPVPEQNCRQLAYTTCQEVMR